MSYHEKFNQYETALPGLRIEDVEATSSYLSTITPTELDDLARRKMRTLESLDEESRQFRMFIDEGENPEQALFVFGEFANGMKPSVLARAEVIRRLAAPDATLIVQPNSTHDQANTNFSKYERSQLRRGDLAPMLWRTAVALDAIGGNVSDLSLVGPSQGGAVALAYAVSERPDASVTILETPTVVERSTFGVAKDFMGAGGGLIESLDANYGKPEEAELAAHMHETTSFVNLFLKYPRDMLHPDNLASIGMLGNGDAASQMEQILDARGSVAHAWATGDRVSPVDANRAVRDRLESRTRYVGREFDGLHDVTNIYWVLGALAREAASLKKI